MFCSLCGTTAVVPFHIKNKRLKPRWLCGLCGTTEVVPYPASTHNEFRNRGTDGTFTAFVRCGLNTRKDSPQSPGRVWEKELGDEIASVPWKLFSPE
jgi:ribosomal protein S27AE